MFGYVDPTNIGIKTQIPFRVAAVAKENTLGKTIAWFAFIVWSDIWVA